MVTRKLKGTKVWLERYEVEGRTGTYIVAQRPTGEWGCGCPHWKFHKAPKPKCRHILALLGAMASFVDYFAVGRKFRDAGDVENYKAVVESQAATAPPVTMVVEGEVFRVGRKFREA